MAGTPAADVPARQVHGGDQTHRTWYDAEDIIDAINVKAATTCADLGCGEGTFTFVLARRVGKDGKVYAVDTSVAALDQLKIQKPGANIVTLRAELSDTRLPSASCDLVLLAFSLSSTYDAGGVLSEAGRLLKPDGRLAIVEWRPVPPPPGPPLQRRTRSDRMQRLLENHGFMAGQRLREGAVYYTIVTQKAKAKPKAPPSPTPPKRPAKSSGP